MPLIDTDKPRAVARLKARLGEILYLRGTGPVSQEFFQWVDEAALTVEQAFGRDSAQVDNLARAVGDRSPIYSQGIPPYGEWGLLARLDRAEAVLKAAIDYIERPPSPPPPPPPPPPVPAAIAIDAADKEIKAEYLARVGPRITGRDRPCPPFVR